MEVQQCIESSDTNQSSDLDFLPLYFSLLVMEYFVKNTRVVNYLITNNSITNNKIPGGDTGGATPLPIPNREVKPTRADGTVLVTVR